MSQIKAIIYTSGCWSGKRMHKGAVVAVGAYRVAINGFSCVSETWDDALNWDGQHDEVYFRTLTKVVSKDGSIAATSDDSSMTMGDVRGFSGRLQVGTARDWLGSRTGGIVSGDAFPTATPYLRNVDLDAKAQADPRRYPPYKIWQGELSDSDDTLVFLTPTLWEWDPGQGAIDGWITWQKNVDTQFGSRAKDIFSGIWPVSRPVFDAVSLGIQTFATLAGLWSPFGRSMQRPIGLQRDPNQPDGALFNPTVVTLTYGTAEYLCSHDISGLGKGVIGIRCEDDPFLRGHYVFYVQIDKLGGANEFPDGSIVRETSKPEVYVIFGGAKFWVPNPDTLFRLYGGWASVRQVPDGALADAGIGDTPVDGTLLKEENAPAVWRMENRTRRWVVSPTVLARHGGWAAVRTVPDNALAPIPTGSPLSN
ncbi:hypothetical protein [Streptomyces mirabilis]|uniref:hypothetical protein n=1 Tax=Streptomyces mirabilis TaxID=68239 RepID=UPI0036567D74